MQPQGYGQGGGLSDLIYSLLSSRLSAGEPSTRDRLGMSLTQGARGYGPTPQDQGDFLRSYLTQALMTEGLLRNQGPYPSPQKTGGRFFDLPGTGRQEFGRLDYGPMSPWVTGEY